MKLEDVVLLNN